MKYTIDNIFFTSSQNVKFKYDVCVVNYIEGKCFVTNLREKKYFLKSYGYNDIYTSPCHVLDELELVSATDCLKCGYYKFAFSDRKNKLSVRELLKLQKFVDKHQPVLEKTM